MSSIKTRRQRTMVLGTARPGTGLDTQPREPPQPGDLSIQYARRASRQAGESNLIVERNTSETRVAKRWRRKAKAPVSAVGTRQSTPVILLGFALARCPRTWPRTERTPG